MASRCQQPVGDMWRLPHPHGRVATNPRRPPGMYERLPSYAHRAAGVHQARVPHLVGAPCGTTAPAGPHRLMPVLVPAVVPLVPSNKAMSRAFMVPPSRQNRHYAYRHPVYTIEARSRAGRSVGHSHACLPNCLPIGTTWTDQACTQADAHCAQRSCHARPDLG
jgi:hypothetical protein